MFRGRSCRDVSCSVSAASLAELLLALRDVTGQVRGGASVRVDATRPGCRMPGISLRCTNRESVR
jgi:hypothetical protein